MKIVKALLVLLFATAAVTSLASNGQRPFHALHNSLLGEVHIQDLTFNEFIAGRMPMSQCLIKVTLTPAGVGMSEVTIEHSTGGILGPYVHVVRGEGADEASFLNSAYIVSWLWKVHVPGIRTNSDGAISSVIIQPNISAYSGGIDVDSVESFKAQFNHVMLSDYALRNPSITMECTDVPLWAAQTFPFKDKLEIVRN